MLIPPGLRRGVGRPRRLFLLACALWAAYVTLALPARAAPITGKIGVGTWNTQAEFTDIRVTRGAETLYQSDFTTGTSGFTSLAGSWVTVGGSLRQTSSATPALALAGETAWRDYTLTLRARKISGSEGFLVAFGSPGDMTKTWWNIGGWNNTQYAIEAPGAWAPAVPGAIQAGRWYDIRVELEDGNVRCYLDGVLIHDTAPVPIAGKVGVGTWNTQAEFTDIRVVQGDQTLYQSDFSAGMAGWTTLGGAWQVVGGNLRQGSTATPALAMVGNVAWSDYTLTLRARKISGSEGFLVVFGSPDDTTKTWWNIGGWANSRHAIEAPGIWVPSVSGAIQTGRWYDIRVELRGAGVRCYLDGVLVHDTERVLDNGDRMRRFTQVQASPGFGLLNPWEQQVARDLAGLSLIHI